MIAPEAETVRPPSGRGFTDAVTFSFGDVATERYGLVRLGIAEGRLGSALLVLFAGREPAAVLAQGGIELAPGAGWDALALAGVRATVERPHARWGLAFAAAEGAWLDLAFAAVGAPAELGGAGTEGYEQLCRVTGTISAGGAATRLDCLGQRGHEWGVTDWDAIGLTRTLAAWLEDGTGIALHAARPAGARGHDEEGLAAALLGPGGPVPVADPRLSTTYDGEGRQRRAGLELWMDEEEGPPRRAAGEVLCGSTLELGALRLDCAFLRWHAEGQDGVGRYDVLRRA